MGHIHISRVKEWGLDAQYNSYPVSFDCTGCDETSITSFEDDSGASVHSTHLQFVDNCFGCKVVTLQLATGDAGSDKGMPAKKWDSELQAYRDARDQGIQPAGTTRKLIESAVKASDTMGRAYNAEKMPEASKINNKSAEAMKAMGV